MRAVIARELERAPRHDVGIAVCRKRASHQQRERRDEERPPPHYQSSLTARTASPAIAARALAVAVAAAATSMTAQNAASGTHGIAMSMLQWNDCRFTTWIRIRLMTAPSPSPTARPSALTARPSVASIAPICRRVSPRWRSIPNSRRRASTSAPKLDDRPVSPITSATSSST